VVEGNAGPKKTQGVAEAYLRFLYTPKGQAIAARHHYRPATPEAANAKDVAQFVKLDLVTIDNDFGGWAKAQPEHFGEGGTFDQLYGKK
jgi:ABC-type sulfate transport system substrate-binding protein